MKDRTCQVPALHPNDGPYPGSPCGRPAEIHYDACESTSEKCGPNEERHYLCEKHWWFALGWDHGNHPLDGNDDPKPQPKFEDALEIWGA